MIPFLRPNIPTIEDFKKYLNKSYDTRIFSNNGPCTQELETRLQTYMGVGYKPVLMCNATIALTVLLEAFNLNNADILIPSFTFSATAHSVLNAKCKPILVDIDDDLYMCLKDASKKITKNTKAMIVVHTVGYVPEYKKYEEFAKENNLILIFDSAATLGASYSDGKKVGIAGDAEVFSLHATKTFGIGEGSLVTSKHGKVLDICRQMINFGFEQHNSTMFGTNAKISEFHAAVGLATLDVIDIKINTKNQIFEYYKSLFIPSLNVRYLNNNSAHQVFPIIFEAEKTRNDVQNALSKREIGNKIYYTPIHRQDYFKKICSIDNLDRTNYYADRILCIPFFEEISKYEQNTVFNTIRGVL